MKNIICLLLMLFVQLLAAMQQDNYNSHLSAGQVCRSVITTIEEAGVHTAAKNGNIETVQKLLDRGVSINERNVDYETPLHVAAMYGKDTVVRLLLSKEGIDINATDALMYSTPLHLAASYAHCGVVQLLLAQKGIDINATDFMGNTPLHCSALRGNNAIVKLLLAKEGIDIGIKSNDGKTPLDIASDNRFGNTVKIIDDFLEQKLFHVLDFTEDEKKRFRLLSFKTASPQLRCHTMRRMRAAQIQSRSMFIPAGSATIMVALSYISEEDG